MTTEQGAGAPQRTNANGANGAAEPPTSETVLLTPAEASGGLRATFWVEVTNQDVGPVTYTLAGHDRGQRLRYVFEPVEMTLAPGQKARVNLQVYAPQHVIGRARRHLFAVIVSHGDGRAPRMLAGRFKQQALVPEWILALVCIGLLAWAASYLVAHHQSTAQPSSKSLAPASTRPSSSSATSVRTQPPFAVRADSNEFSVLDSGIRILTINTNSAGFKAKKRAEIVAERLNDILMNDLPKPDRSVEGFFQGDLNGAQIVGFGYLTGHRNVKNATADLIVTVDEGSARLDGRRTPRVLACWWRDIFRDWLLMNQGKAPSYTTKYTPVLKDFYSSLQEQGDGTESQRFAAALSHLADTDYREFNSLRTLYSAVPANYVPNPDDIHNPVLSSD